ncbi:glycosyl hydrolase 2 galactose-binding domain-containing protein, partial [Demequina sp.]|uniref:glycosyl hydrolase 2 galactose-binding domain-containing protein n=1 Tax=Demequina sp. TaxID=2050685 RepID=UPI003A88A88B
MTLTGTTRTPACAWTLHLIEPAADAPAGAVAALSEGVTIGAPSSVLGRLIELGLAGDVTVDAVEQDVAWVASSMWSYRTTLARLGDGSRVRLVFEGVDTFATVRVDGVELLRTDDMFHRWELDLGVDGTAGQWDIEVEFDPVEPIAWQREAQQWYPHSELYPIPYNQVRKMACSFGWDWGPTTMTAGLYRSVVLERTPIARISASRLSALWSDGAVLEGHLQFEGEVDACRLAVRDLDRATTVSHVLTAADARAGFSFDVPGALRWDVRERGDQPLYDVEVTALGADGAVLDTVVRRMGFRTVELVQEPDEVGTSFEIHVNGSRVWCRGFNWIPADVLPERISREHLRALIEQAVATGANMLRVWGGGVVESDDFYDLCDELGVL